MLWLLHMTQSAACSLLYAVLSPHDALPAAPSLLFPSVTELPTPLCFLQLTSFQSWLPSLVFFCLLPSFAVGISSSLSHPKMKWMFVQNACS